MTQSTKKSKSPARGHSALDSGGSKSKALTEKQNEGLLAIYNESGGSLSRFVDIDLHWQTRSSLDRLGFIAKNGLLVKLTRKGQNYCETVLRKLQPDRQFGPFTVKVESKNDEDLANGIITVNVSCQIPMDHLLTKHKE